MESVTLFSFGYYGWGSATNELIEVVDAVEASRGFAPPIFAEIRISRSGRAEGFVGEAFEKVIGPSRYRWFERLGNPGVLDHKGMRIKDPDAANDLLDLAVESARSNRRVIFYCGCELPCNCHRSEVARLVLAAAERRKLAVEVVEWPGGEPRSEPIQLELPKAEFERAWKGAKSVLIGEAMPLAEAGKIPWHSLLQVRPQGMDEFPPWRLITGPARYKKAGWYLPVFGAYDDEANEVATAEQRKLRQEYGYEARVVSV